MVHCDFVDFLVCRRIVIDVGDFPQCCIPDITGLKFLHHILDEGRYTKETRCLFMSIVDFSVAGINIILTCLKALDIYPIDRQALIYFWYHATDFDTLRTSCLIFSVITVLDFNVYCSVTHVDSAFQVSPAMNVTCSFGWGDRHTKVIFKSCVLQHLGHALISGNELPLCHSYDTWVFEMAESFFVKFVDPSHSVYM